MRSTRFILKSHGQASRHATELAGLIDAAAGIVRDWAGLIGLLAWNLACFYLLALIAAAS